MAQTITIENYVAIFLAMTAVVSMSMSIYNAYTSVRKDTFTKLEAKVTKLEKRLKTALIANTKMRSIIQDMITILEEVLEIPLISSDIKTQANSLIGRAKIVLSEAELLLLESITDA